MHAQTQRVSMDQHANGQYTAQGGASTNVGVYSTCNSKQAWGNAGATHHSVCVVSRYTKPHFLTHALPNIWRHAAVLPFSKDISMASGVGAGACGWQQEQVNEPDSI